MTPTENPTPDDNENTTPSPDGGVSQAGNQHELARSINSLDNNAANISQILSEIREEINFILEDFKYAADIDTGAEGQQEYDNFVRHMKSNGNEIFTEQLGTGESRPPLVLNTNSVSHDVDKLKRRTARAVEVLSNYSDTTRGQLLRVLPDILGRIEAPPRPEVEPPPPQPDDEDRSASREEPKPKGLIRRMAGATFSAVASPLKATPTAYNATVDFYEAKVLKPLGWLDPRSWLKKKK